MNNAGKSLELFFIDGRPDGMLTAEVFNWTGHVLRVPRTQLKEALARKEAGFTGVYILLGETEAGAAAYIGEAEELAARLRQHAANKDFWDSVVLVTTSANNLQKAHIKYLESRLIQIAVDVGSATVINGNQPSPSSLSEASQSNMEAFLETLLMVLPAIRVDIFLDKNRTFTKPTATSEQRSEETRFVFNLGRVGISATAVLRDGEMIVLAGSGARHEWAGQNQTSYFNLYQELLKSGVIAVEGKSAVFRTDYAFASPSAAAAVVSGRAANGRTSWLVEGSSRTYAEWEEAELSKNGDLD